MATLKGPVLCPSLTPRPLKKKSGHQIGRFSISRPGSENLLGASGFSLRYHLRRHWSVNSSLDSPFGDSGSIAGNYKESDEDYVDCTVIEAVEVRSGPHGLTIKMLDGNIMRSVFNNPDNMLLPDTSPYPAIVLKMEDGSGLLLPIIVVEQPNAMLMDAVRDVRTVRPTVYQVLKEMIDTMGYEIRLARITQRNREVYVARLYLSQAPIQVNKHLAYNDGMTVVDPPMQYIPFLSGPSRYLDRLQSNYVEEEFDLVRDMMVAATEERYNDAAQYRDKLLQLRLKRNRQ